MEKLYGDSVLPLLGHILKSCLESSTSPPEWKKANVVPVQKMGNKQCLKNYRLISLLPICGKIFTPHGKAMLYVFTFSFIEILQNFVEVFILHWLL